MSSKPQPSSSSSSSFTTTQSQSRNWSLLSIPAAYTLAFPPHLYFFANAMIASKYTYSNTLPRTNLDVLKDKLPAATYGSLVRAHGAHMNALEGFPFFAAAILAGNYAKLESKDLNLAAAEYVGARIVYTVLYMGTTSEKWSYLRTGVYAYTIAIPFYVLWKAGKKIRDTDLGGEKSL